MLPFNTGFVETVFFAGIDFAFAAVDIGFEAGDSLFVGPVFDVTGVEPLDTTDGFDGDTAFEAVVTLDLVLFADCFDATGLLEETIDLVGVDFFWVGCTAAFVLVLLFATDLASFGGLAPVRALATVVEPVFRDQITVLEVDDESVGNVNNVPDLRLFSFSRSSQNDFFWFRFACVNFAGTVLFFVASTLARSL